VSLPGDFAGFDGDLTTTDIHDHFLGHTVSLQFKLVAFLVDLGSPAPPSAPSCPNRPASMKNY
jgi:hypothetical protein